jgi:Putative MetA-pathway of phenol degradation
MRLFLIAAIWLGLAPLALADEPGSALRPLCPDRPTRSTAPCTLDPGHWQVEADLVDGAFQHTHGTTSDVWLLVSPTLKYGVNDRLDLEVTLTPDLTQTTRDRSGPVSTIQGFGDLVLRAKLNIWGQGGPGPWSVAIAPGLKVPTARRGLGNDAWEGGVIAPISYKVSDALSFGFSPEVDLLKDAQGNGRHVNIVQTAGVNWSLPRGWTLSGEIWGSVNDEPGGVVRQATFDLAVAWQAGDNVQWDAGLNLGLNHETPGAQVYFGLSRRF